MKKKPHKVKVFFDNSEKTKVTRSFATEGEADAFIEGLNVANTHDGINGFTYSYNRPEKPLTFADLGKRITKGTDLHLGERVLIQEMPKKRRK